jgi:uncharacterized protein (TIGR00725 family)
MERLPIVGVMGSGKEPWEARSVPLGRWLAGQGVHLLTGGGAGVMEAVCRGFTEGEPRRGLAIGVLPGDPQTGEPLPGYPNPFVEIAIRTHLPRGDEAHSRNHLNVLSADVVVALPGGGGTLHEVILAMRYDRPWVVWCEAPGELPGIPEDAPIAGSLKAVCAFVADALREAGRTAVSRPPRRRREPSD